MSKNINIQIIRISAMLMIIVCHLTQVFDNKYIVMTGQFFNVGVYIFLFISGYLYGTKKIESFCKWYFRRFIKLLIPMYLFMLFVFGINYYMYNFIEVEKIVIYLFNLQGFLGGILGAGHLWFLSSLMLCYLILPLLQFMRKSKKKFIQFFIVLTFFIVIMYCYNSNIMQQLIYVLTFSIGYFIKKFNINNEKYNSILFYILIFFMAFIRLVFRYFFDNTIFYNNIITSFTQMVISLCIFYIFYKRNNKKNDIKIVNWLDSISYYVYITHYIFIVGSIKTIFITEYFFINICLTIILSFIFAEILKIISNVIIKRILRESA